MAEIMQYMLYGIVTLGILGGIFCFYHVVITVMITMWKDKMWGDRFVAVFIGFLLLVFAYYIYLFLKIGYHAFLGL